MSPDLVNGLFEMFGSAFIATSVLKLAREKVVRGIHWLHVGFFASWGYWNLYYYAAIEQPLSWYGGVLVTITNSVYLGQLLYYTHKERGAPYVPLFKEPLPPQLPGETFGDYIRRTDAEQ